jgi:hypothetical protein
MLQSRTLWSVVLLAFVVLLLYPFKTRVVPPWRLCVADEEGRPIPKMAVRYFWRHYSIDWESKDEWAKTDANGCVSFPERTTRASLAQRIIKAVFNAPWIVHASWGPHGHIVVGVSPYEYETTSVTYDGSGPPPERVVAKRRQKPLFSQC